MAYKIVTLFLLLTLSLPLNFQCTSSPNWIRGGYWHAHSELPIAEIHSALFSHLMCAFAFINSSTYNIFINSTSEQFFVNFTNAVKHRNPSVITLLSVWGGAIFSSMINQSSNRRSFIKSFHRNGSVLRISWPRSSWCSARQMYEYDQIRNPI